MRIGVLGSGSWGTALAQVLCDNGHEVLLYGNCESEIQDINERGQNRRYFGELRLAEGLRASTAIEAIRSYTDVILLAVPTRFFGEVLNLVKPYIRKDTIVVNVAKGFEWGTGKRLSVCIRDTLGDTAYAGLCSLIGPSHAEEVILRKLTSVAAVSTDAEVAGKVQRLFSNDYMRVYTGSDEVGAEYGVAVKNIIALASGMLEGRGYGDNAKAALITRGLCEMIRYGVAKGGDRNTFIGLTGVGDLIVTCFSPHSRNYQAGLQIGRADSAAVLEQIGGTVEGVHACREVSADAARIGIEMPIVSAVGRVLFEGALPSEEIGKLMRRPLREE